MLSAFATVERQFHRHRFTLLWIGFLVAAGVLLERALRPVVRSYALRDILINNADGLVRRGLGGEAVRALQGLFGGSFTFWAWALASLVALAVFVLSIRIYRRLPDDPKYLPLILAPWGLLFYAYDSGGSFRKEIVGYLAVALVLNGALAGGLQAMWIWAGAGVAVFLLSLFVHEATLFLWPALAVGLWLGGQAWPGARRALVALSLVTGAAGTLAVWYLIRLPIPDPAVICAAVAEQVCDGPFGWLTRGMADGMAYVIGRREWDESLNYALLAVMGAVPFFAVRFGRFDWRLTAVAIAVAFASVAPLFVFAYDWGRWIQMALFPLALVCASTVILGVARYRRLLPPGLAMLYFASFSVPHAVGDVRLKAAYLWGALAALVALNWALEHMRAVRAKP